MNEDPLIAHETQPTRTMAALVRADERLKKEFPLITVPVLILHGRRQEHESQRQPALLRQCGIRGHILKMTRKGKWLHDLSLGIFDTVALEVFRPLSLEDLAAMRVQLCRILECE